MEFLTSFGFRINRTIFSRLQSFGKLGQLLNLLVLKVFHVTAKKIFIDPFVRSANADFVSLIVE